MARIPIFNFFVTLSLYLHSLVFSNNKNTKYVFLFGLVLGLGAYYKLMIATFAVPLILAHLLIYRKTKFSYMSLKKCLLFITAFIIGFAPSLIFQFQLNFPILDYSLQATDHNQFQIISQLSTRIKHLNQILSQSPKHYSNGLQIVGIANMVFFYISGTYLLLRGKQKDRLLLLAGVFYILISIFQPNVMIPEHLYLIVPIIITLITAGIIRISRALFQYKNRKYIISSILVILIFLNLAGIIRILATKNNYNNYLICYEIGRALRNKKIDTVYSFAFDSYCLSHSLYFTSGGQKIVKASDALKGKIDIRHHKIYPTPTFERQDNASREIIEVSENKNNIYIASKLKFGPDQNYSRLLKNDRLNQIFQKNGYTKIIVPSKTQDKTYLIWAKSKITKQLKSQLK